jgi:hypothetical protein
MGGDGMENVLTMSQNVHVPNPTRCTAQGQASESGVDGVSGNSQGPLMYSCNDVVLR